MGKPWVSVTHRCVRIRGPPTGWSLEIRVSLERGDRLRETFECVRVNTQEIVADSPSSLSCLLGDRVGETMPSLQP